MFTPSQRQDFTRRWNETQHTTYQPTSSSAMYSSSTTPSSQHFDFAKDAKEQQQQQYRQQPISISSINTASTISTRKPYESAFNTNNNTSFMASTSTSFYVPGTPLAQSTYPQSSSQFPLTQSNMASSTTQPFQLSQSTYQQTAPYSQSSNPTYAPTSQSSQHQPHQVLKKHNPSITSLDNFSITPLRAKSMSTYVPGSTVFDNSFYYSANQPQQTETNNNSSILNNQNNMNNNRPLSSSSSIIYSNQNIPLNYSMTPQRQPYESAIPTSQSNLPNPMKVSQSNIQPYQPYYASTITQSSQNIQDSPYKPMSSGNIQMQQSPQKPVGRDGKPKQRAFSLSSHNDKQSGQLILSMSFLSYKNGQQEDSDDDEGQQSGRQSIRQSTNTRSQNQRY